MSATNNPLLFKYVGNPKKVQEDNKTIEYIHSLNNQIIAKKINEEVIKKYLWQGLNLLAVYGKNTKLIRFGKRDYSSGQRRWTASNPIGFDSGDLNLYGYILNDPIQFVDPSGEKEANNKYIDKLKKLLKLCDQDGNIDCNKLAIQGHRYCMTQGPAGYFCQKAVEMLFERCMLDKIKCKKECKDEK